MTLLRDQARACLAYDKVAEVSPEMRDDYRIAVQAFGANLRRVGLATALSLLERRNGKGGRLLLSDLAAADVPGLGRDPERLCCTARELDDLGGYMLATRELLRLASWFNRAVQATFVGERDDAQ